MSFNPFSLQGKTIFVTGASSGIGQCSAILMSKMGARLIITGRSAEKLGITYSALEGSGHQQHTADLRNPAHLKDLMENVPPLDGFFYSAGLSKMFPVKYIPDAIIEELYDINTFIPLKMTRFFIKNRKINSGASLLYMSSIGPFLGIPGQVAYSSSKAAVLSFVKIMAKEFSLKKIRVNCLCPAMVETPLLENSPISEERYTEDKKSYPLGYGKPEDVAHAAIYFLSDASRWVTGTHLIMDGGLTLI